jgi:hypothetical protein
MLTAETGDSISIGQILNLFGVRGFAFLLLVLALLNVVIFMVPLISMLFGLPMIILAAQMVLGLRAPIFPHVILDRTIKREALMAGLGHAIFWLEKIEHYIKPRLPLLTMPELDRIHGLLALIFAVMVTIPIPLFNVPPSLGIAFLAIGMLQRDGLFILFAYAIGYWCIILFKSLGHLAHSLSHGG